MATVTQSATGPKVIAVSSVGEGAIAGKSFGEIASLDGIRACAVLLVFAAHAGLNERVPGNFGVTVFFFLSGYLITTLLRLEYERTRRIGLGQFYLRRALRIMPPFYVVLAGASLLTATHLLAGSLHLDAVLAQVAHLSNYWVIWHGWWDGRAPGTWIYWSLAVEEHFYLVFPLAYIAMNRFLPSPRAQMAVLVGVCVAVLVWRCVLVLGLHSIKERTYVATDTRIDSIIFGAILAVGANPALRPDKFASANWKRIWLPIGLAGLVVSFLVRNPAFQETVRYSLQGLCLFPLFIVAIRFPDWSVFRILNLAPVKFIGLISYTLYLVHPTVLFFVGEWTRVPRVFQGALSLTVALAISTLMYYSVERPAGRMRRRLSKVWVHS